MGIFSGFGYRDDDHWEIGTIREDEGRVTSTPKTGLTNPDYLTNLTNVSYGVHRPPNETGRGRRRACINQAEPAAALVAINVAINV